MQASSSSKALYIGTTTVTPGSIQSSFPGLEFGLTCSVSEPTDVVNFFLMTIKLRRPAQSLCFIHS